MNRTASLLTALGASLTLAACGGDAAEEVAVRNAVSFLASTDGDPGIFVEGRQIVVNYAQRPRSFAEQVRRAALEATNATNGKRVMLYVVDSVETPAAVPADGQYYCRLQAFEGAIAESTCWR